MYLSLNQKKAPLNDPKVIEAVKWAIDYEGMTKTILRCQYTPHQAFLPQTYLGELKDRPYKLAIAKAKAQLDGADVTNSKVYTATVCAEDPQYLASRMVRSVADPLRGPVLQPGIVPPFPHSPGRA